MNVITPVAAAGPGDTDAPAADHADRRAPVVAVVLATLVCAGLVAHRIGEHGLWFDEGATVGTVVRPVGDALWRIYHWELNQSPYHLLALGWLRLVDGEAAMRALSAAFAVASVPLAFVLGRRLLGARAAAVAAVLLAVHPFAVQWGQQLRGYTLLLALTLLSTWLLVRVVEEPTTGRAVAYGVVAAVSVYAQLFSALVLGAHALAVLVAARSTPRRVVATAVSVAGVLVLPMAEFFVTRDGDPLEWVESPSRIQVMGTAQALAGGGRVQLALYGLVALAGCVVLLRRAVGASRPIERFRALVPVLVLVVPPLATLALSVTVKPLVEARFLIIVLPGLVLVAAAGIDEAFRHRRILGAIAIGALLVASGAGLRDWYEREPFDQWREAVQEVQRAAEPGDIVLTSPSRAVHVVRYYADDLGVPAVVGTPDDPAAVDPGTVFQLIRFDDDPSERPYLRPDVADWLASRYRVVDEQRFAGVLVLRHARR